ncbi:phosphate ABC transporter permease PstA [Salinirarus marinus]|uniref:phosphate ABC transporter permease PstA n=1 Tax=Salinirarus marinus TaxID=3068310 RepID=UPI003C6C4021
MSTDARDAVEDGFGHVSRTVGTVFRYLLLVSTLVGIVTLGVLLVYVANDAIRPLTADPGWHLTFVLAFALPSLLVGGYLYRRDKSALFTGLNALGVPAVSLLFASAAAMLFVDVVPPLIWFAYVVAVAIPLVVLLATTRYSHRIPFLARVATLAAVTVASLGVVPGAIQSLPFVPQAWLVVAATLGVPVAGVAGTYADRRWGRRAAVSVAVAALVATVAAPFAGPTIGLDPLPATVLMALAGVPTAVYVGTVVVNQPERRVGLLLPLVVVAGALVGGAVVDALGFAGPQAWIDWQFLTSDHSNTPAEAGIYPAIVGTILLMVVVALASFPVGVGAAVYLEEYAPDNTFTRVVDVNISNLAGVPSVVYGLLGLGVFVRYGGMTPGTVVVGGMTLALLILPIIIISAREAIRSVPDSMRQASYGMGATRWQTVKNVVLPRSFPGILTGTILALGRAIGETAPLLMIGAPQIFDLPTALDARVGAMPLQLYVWATTFASPEFYTTALAAGVVTLLVAMLAMNSIAIVLRNKYQREQ